MLSNCYDAVTVDLSNINLSITKRLANRLLFDKQANTPAIAYTAYNENENNNNNELVIRHPTYYAKKTEMHIKPYQYPRYQIEEVSDDPCTGLLVTLNNLPIVNQYINTKSSNAAFAIEYIQGELEEEKKHTEKDDDEKKQATMEDKNAFFKGKTYFRGDLSQLLVTRDDLNECVSLYIAERVAMDVNKVMFDHSVPVYVKSHCICALSYALSKHFSRVFNMEQKGARFNRVQHNLNKIFDKKVAMVKDTDPIEPDSIVFLNSIWTRNYTSRSDLVQFANDVLDLVDKDVFVFSLLPVSVKVESMAAEFGLRIFNDKMMKRPLRLVAFCK